MVANINNILQSQNKSRAKNTDNGSRNESVDKTGSDNSFIEILQERNEEKSRSGRKKSKSQVSDLSVFAQASAMLPFSLILGSKSDKSSNGDQTEKDLSGTLGDYINGLGVDQEGNGGTGNLMGNKKKSKSGKISELENLASQVNLKSLEIEKKVKPTEEKTPFQELSEYLPSGRISVLAENDEAGGNKAAKSKNKLDGYLEPEMADADADNNHPLHNNILQGGDNDTDYLADIAGIGEKESPGSKNGNYFSTFEYQSGKAQVSGPNMKLNTSTLSSYRTYGPFSLDELSPALSGLAKNLPADTVYQARLTLKPESLGTIFVEISLNENMASINIKADSRETVKAIENQLVNLREKLSEQGLGVENIDVNMSRQENDLTGNQGNWGNGGSPREEREERRHFVDSFRKIRDIDDINGVFSDTYVQYATGTLPELK